MSRKHKKTSREAQRPLTLDEFSEVVRALACQSKLGIVVCAYVQDDKDGLGTRIVVHDCSEKRKAGLQQSDAHLMRWAIGVLHDTSKAADHADATGVDVGAKPPPATNLH